MKIKTILAGLLMGLFMVSVSEASNVKRVDYFNIVFDHSGSMMMKDDNGFNKMALAKMAVKNVLDCIPDELKYTSQMSMSAGYDVVSNGAFDKSRMYADINKISENEEIFGRMSPLSDAVLKETESSRAYKKGSMVLVTDGDWNEGEPLYTSVEKLYKKHPNMTVYVIGFFDTENGSKTIEKLASLNKKSVVISVYDLFDEKNAEMFAKNVFYGWFEDREVYFDFDKYSLRSEVEKALSEIKKDLEENYVPEEVALNGWTCYIGSDKYNQKLSVNRAKAVNDYLGMKETVYQGNGKSYKYDNKDKNQIMYNRRVDISVR